VGISDLLALSEDTVFGQLAEAAIYTPAGGTPTAVRVIPMAPAEVLDFSGTRLTAETDSFEVRASEMPGPAAGDGLLYGQRSLVVKQCSYKDGRRRIWLLETRPA
jgi:hypothetical protein